jgi:chromate transporter
MPATELGSTTGGSTEAPMNGESPFSIFMRFLRFGFLAWGGPVAQIAMVKRELIDDERWIGPARFNRLLAAYQVLPGPEAHELCVHLGMIRGGRLGGFLAGLGFMLPGFILVLALAFLYTRIDLDNPALAAIFLGVQIGVVAIIVRAVHRIGEHILVSWQVWAIAALVAIATFLGASFWITLPAAGIAYALFRSGFAVAAIAVALVAGGIAATVGMGAATSTAATPAPTELARQGVAAAPLFLAGLKAGLFTFGGAYTAIPFVRDDAVGRGWIGEPQFLDGLALSGLIPAPLIIFATFVGYYAGGLAGALAMTVGIFLPAFAFPLLFHDKLERVVENNKLHHFLEGVGAGVVALIALTTLQIGLGLVRAVPNPLMALPIFLGALALVYIWKSKMNVMAVIGLSALAGLNAFAWPPWVH